MEKLGNANGFELKIFIYRNEQLFILSESCIKYKNLRLVQDSGFRFLS